MKRSMILWAVILAGGVASGTELKLTDPAASPQTKKLAWVLVWRNADQRQNYAPFPGAATVENFKTFEADPFTLLLEDLPPMYK